MTNELKTLKDCKDLGEARIAAIKWVQSSREEKLVTEEGEVFDNPYYGNDGLLLQKFANISEEDLK